MFCELCPPDNFPVLFYREPKAPDMNLEPSDFNHDAVREASLFWITGIGLSDQPSRSTLIGLLQKRGRRAVTVIDLDYRPMFWSSPEEASTWVRRALAHVTVAVGNERGRGGRR